MRTWLDIDLALLDKNYEQVRELTHSRVTAVLKANAYGHGSVMVAKELMEMGCDSFAVSCAREAEELVRNGIQAEILIMGTVEEDEVLSLLASDKKARIIFTAADFSDLAVFHKVGTQLQQPLTCHLKVNTGFHRLGFEVSPESAREIAEALDQSMVRASGLYSHLGLVSRERDEAQYRKLMAMRDFLRAFGVGQLEMHLCDSIGLVRYPKWHFDRVRIGAFLYGVRPSRTENEPFVCHETLTLCTKVAQVRDVPSGSVIGYSEQVTDHPVRIATLCAGYGDGYPRHLSEGKGQVLIHGVRCPVIGLVCMDQMMVDVSHVDCVLRGDTATLLGGGIGYGEYAQWADTNRNECLAILSRRPVRVYHKNGRIVGISDELRGEKTL